MTLTDEIIAAIRFEMRAGDAGDSFDAERLGKSICGIMDRHKAVVDSLAAQFHKLMSDETALTIQLSDGCVAKVKFSAPVTHSHMVAFAKIFQSIVDNYVVTDKEQS